MTDLVRVIGVSVLSVALVAFGFYVLLHKGYDAATQKVAAGWIGLVIGYWLK